MANRAALWVGGELFVLTQPAAAEYYAVVRGKIRSARSFCQDDEFHSSFACGRMGTRKRHITSAILLASYVLACAVAWVHTTHRCGSTCRPGNVASAAIDHSPCGTHHHCRNPQHTSTPADSADRLQSDQQSHALLYWHDDCTICRFQLTSKLVTYVPVTACCSLVYPRRIALEMPLFRVAPLQATPDGRGPPNTA